MPPSPEARLRTAAARSPLAEHGRGGGGSRWGPVLVLAALACVVRVPSFLRPVWNPDEGFLATQARILAAGGDLYDTVVDRKPPFVPWLYEAAFAVFGDGSLWPVRVAAVLAQLGSAVLLASLARRWWGARAGVQAGVLYLLVSIGLNPEDAQGAGFEVFMAPWTVAAVWCADRRRWVPAGLAVAGAALTKQTGLAVLVPVVVLLWTRRGGARGLVQLAVGVVAPVAVVALGTGPRGFVFWTLTGSGSYASVEGSVWHAVGRAVLNTAIVGAACAGLLAPVGRRLAGGGRAAPPEVRAWLAASALAVTAGFHFFGHYFLQLLPPLTLLAVSALQGLDARAVRGALVLAAASATVFLTWGLAAQTTELRHTDRLARTVAGLTGPHERVLLWGMHPEGYWLADRRPASRYLTAGLLTNYSGGRGGARVGERYAVPGTWSVFRRELAAHPPALVVDDSRGEPYAPSRMPTLARLLAADYRLAGTWDGAVVYVREGRVQTAGRYAVPAPLSPRPAPGRTLLGPVTSAP